MKILNKYLIIFVLASCFFMNDILADYKATVLNPEGASCNLYTPSTGYCFYASGFKKNSGIIYLDTGDEVTVLTNYSTLASPDKSLCSDYYVYSAYKNSQGTYYGYYCHANLKTGSLLTDDLKNEFKNAGFPESYFEKLAILKVAHPNWSFKAINLGIDFNTAISSENIAGKSLVQKSSSNNYAYLDIDTYSFDYYNDKFVDRDNIGSSNPWYDANKETIAYYMDPRNFLIDMYIFEFEGLSYDSKVSTDTYKKIVSGIFGSDYLSNFINDFVTAGPESGVSPIYLASLSRQEIGNGATPGTAIAGTYNGMYNFYNIGASGGVSPVLNGLETAAADDPSTLRPWNTTYKAIVGGAKWIGQKYINVGQDTSYFKKWDVVYNYMLSKGKTPDHNNFTHQYMTNIMAPSSEAKQTYLSIVANNLLSSSYVFYIPIYNNMPSSTALPTKGGWPNNYLKSLTINNEAVPNFDGGNTEYNYYLEGTDEVKISASTVSSTASISGTGTFKVTSDTSKTITVTAQNGNKKTYKINIKILSRPVVPSTDLQSTMNNSGLKNNDKYLSGITVGSDISSIKTKILNAKSDAKVELKNSNGKEKNSGLVATGDKVTVTVGSETKTYEVVIYGDPSGDGKISPSDYAIIKDTYLGKYTLNGSYKEAADVTKDLKISPSDYAIIKDTYLGKISISQ